MKASISHVTGDDHLDDPAWGSMSIWEGDVGEVDAELTRTGLPLDQLVVGLDGAGPTWARDFLARRRG